MSVRSATQKAHLFDALNGSINIDKIEKPGDISESFVIENGNKPVLDEND